MGIQDSAILVVPSMNLKEMGTEVLYDSLVVVSSVTKGGNTRKYEDHQKSRPSLNVALLLTISELSARY